MSKLSKFLGKLIFTIIGFFWIFVFFVVAVLLIPEASLEKSVTLLEMGLIILFLIPLVPIFLFISFFTWISAFSRFFHRDVFIEEINRSGCPKFMNNYLIKLIK